MNNINVFDYVKWFLDNELDTPRNTFNGNMKLQKLLFFAQLISLTKNKKLLFNDEFCAFENGMVMENVRLEYKNNLNKLLNYKGKQLPKDDIEVLELTKNIYGSEDAETLSEMTHQFTCWKKYFDLSKEKKYKDKKKSIIQNKELERELDNIKDVLDAYEIMNSNEFKKTSELDY